MLKQKPDSEDARALRAGINLDSGQPDKLDSALSELRALVKDTPGDPMLHYNFGRAYLGKGENDSALSEFQQAIKLDPSFLAPQLLAANLSMERQDYRQASQYADQILKLTHDNAAARLLKAASMTGLGNFNEAASELRRLDREYPGAAAPKLQIGNLKLAEKSYKEAETIFRGLYESDRSNLVALSRLIDTYYEQGRYDLAVQYLTKETRTSTSPEVRAMLGEAALRGKKLDVAVQEYSQLASADPKSAVNHLRLGDAYLQKGSIKEAIDQFQIARSLSPKDPLVSAMLALSFHNAGRVEDAQQAYRSTLALQSGNPVVKNNLAYLTADSGGNLKEALQLAQDASRQLPASVPVSDTLGWIYVKMKMTDSALQMLSNVVQKAPEEPIYRYHLAAALYDKGDMSGAKKNLLIAMSNQPLRAYEVKIKELLAKIPN
jgi:tetratricopeptide (TPR) repeat protein